jgi:hypothetical protein
MMMVQENELEMSSENSTKKRQVQYDEDVPEYGFDCKNMNVRVYNNIGYNNEEESDPNGDQ